MKQILNNSFPYVFVLVVFVLLVLPEFKAIGQRQPASNIQNEDKVSEKEKREAIQDLCQRIRRNYVFPDIADKIVERLETNLSANRYAELTDAKSFATQLTKDLRSINNDRHLGIWPTPPKTNADETELGSEFSRSRGRHSNYGFEELKILPGNIGYIKMTSFSLDQLYPDAQGTVAAAMNFVSNTDALIFDLRDNSGGSPRIGRLLSSYLYSSTPVHLNDYYFRTSDSTLAYWTLADIPGTRMPDVHVYILINKNTFSAAEGFAYNLKHLGRATVVGQTSGGGAHGGSTHSISEKFQAYIPYSRSIHPVTKTDFEGTGVKPEIVVNNGDSLIVAQIAAIKALAKIDSKKQYSSLYNDVLVNLNAKSEPIVLSEATLKSYTGIYQISPEKRLTITFEDGQIFGQMSDEKKRVAATPLSQVRFRVEEYGVEFSFDLNKNRKVKGLTIHQGNGVKAKRID